MLNKQPATKRPLMIYSIIAWIIIIVVFFLYWWRLHSNMEIRKEQNRLDWILNEINQLYIVNEDIQNQRNELEAQQTQLHNSAEENRTKIDELREEYDNSKLFLMAWQEKSK